MELHHWLVVSLVVTSSITHIDGGGDDFLVTVLTRLATLSEKIREAGNQIEKLKPEKLKVDLGVLKTKVNCLNDDVHVSGSNNQVGASIDKMRLDLAKLKEENRESESTENTGTATFVRWGKSSCPAGNELVYTGMAGGATGWHVSSATSILCLPEDPVYARFSSELNDNRAEIYGLVIRTNYIGRRGRDLRCAVCASKTKVSTIMVPARNRCHEGWGLEYWGYLYASGTSAYTSDDICVDARQEGSEHPLNNNHRILVRQGTICGSLSCPPYKRIGPIMCAVCSQ